MTKEQTGTKAARIMDLLNRGVFTDKWIAKEVGCSPTYVWAIRKKMSHLDADMGAAVEEAAEANDVDAILEQRGSRYGKFYDHALVTQNLKNVVMAHLQKQKRELIVDQQEALEMIFHKIGRIVNGDPDYADSWIDIAGYAKLVADRLEGRSR